MEKLLRVVKFLRLIDDQGDISITNVALIGVLAKLLLTPQIATADLLAFVATMVGYNVKRFAVNPNAAVSEDTDELRKAIESLQTKVTGLQIGGQIRK